MRNLTVIRDEAKLKTFKLDLDGTATRYAQQEAAFDHLEAKFPGFNRVAACGMADATSIELLIRTY